MPAAGHRQTEPAARTDISRALPAIFAAGLLCGVMDISAAFLLTWFPAHYPPKRLLQGIASGLLGIAYLLLSRYQHKPHADNRASPIARVLAVEAWRVRKRAPLPYGVAIAIGGAITLLHPVGP